LRRYLETLFRHKVLFFIPVIVIPIIALLFFLYSGKEYAVQASMWVEPSPFSVTDPLTSSRMTPNQIEGQAMQEWLATNSFRKEVMDQVGLTAAVQRGAWPVPSRLEENISQTGLDNVPVLRSLLRALNLVGPSTQQEALAAGIQMVGSSIHIVPEGNNLLRVRYEGKEPQLGTRILQESLTLFNKKTLELRTNQAKLAIDFYANQLQTQQQRATLANNAVQQFLQQHPNPAAGQQRSGAEDAELEGLRRTAALEQTLYETTLRTLEQTSQSGQAAITGRDQGFRMIDQPTQVEGGGAVTHAIVMMATVGLLLGLALGLLPVLILTWLDNTARTKEDIEGVIKTPLIAQLPLIPSANGQPKDMVRAAYARSLLSDPAGPPGPRSSGAEAFS